MTNQTISLTCPSCGGKLQISEKINRFACGYCGNEQIVHRESGIVYLEPIAEDVHHIRTGVENIRGGVDKTAAELAIARLTKELSEIESELKTADARTLNSWRPSSDFEQFMAICAAVLFVVGIGSRNVAVWMLFVVCFGIFMILRITHRNEAKALRKETIDDIQAKKSDVQAALTRNRKLV